MRRVAAEAQLSPLLNLQAQQHLVAARVFCCFGREKRGERKLQNDTKSVNITLYFPAGKRRPGRVTGERAREFPKTKVSSEAGIFSPFARAEKTLSFWQTRIHLGTTTSLLRGTEIV
jgi:hypothetical protein